MVLDESLGVDALDPNAATDDNVAANPFLPAYGTPIGLLSNVDLVNTTTTTGEDNEGATTVVTLAIAGGVNGTDSGLQTTDNRQISLFNESGVIVGRMDTAGGVADPAGTVAFAISVNNVGEVTVAQYLSLEHPTPGASYDEAVNLGSLVNAVVTVTDGDGDVATQNIAIGNAIQFQDDGPTAALALQGGVTVVVDESLGQNGAPETEGGASGLGRVTVLGTTLFTSTAITGQDNEGATTVFSLSIVGAGATGLFSTDNQAITLFDDGGVIEGRLWRREHGCVHAHDRRDDRRCDADAA